MRTEYLHQNAVIDAERAASRADAECDRLAGLLRQALAALQAEALKSRPGCFPHAHVIDVIEEELS